MNLQVNRATIVITMMFISASWLGDVGPVLAARQDQPGDATAPAAQKRISVSGGADARANGRKLLRALARIETPPPQPVLLMLGEGIYDLRNRSLLLSSGVSLEGSGEEKTHIVAAGGATNARATIELAGPSSLAKLTVESAGSPGGGAAHECAVAILILSRAELKNVTAIGKGAIRLNYGIRIVRGRVELRGVTASAAGGSIAYGVSIKDSGQAVLFDVKADASGPGENYAVFVINEQDIPEMSLNLGRVRGNGRDGKASHGLRMVGQAEVVIANSTFEASQAGSNFGLSAYGRPPLFLDIRGSAFRATGAASTGLHLSRNTTVRKPGGSIDRGLKIVRSKVCGARKASEDVGIPGLGRGSRSGAPPCADVE